MILFSLLAICGCGPAPVTGGTAGEITVAGQPLSEVQITVHQAASGSFTPVGFGVSGTDGSFALVTNGAQGPLILPPGDYRFTLESAGAPFVIPAPYQQPSTTPLVITWPTESPRLVLSLPMPLRMVK